MKKHYLSLGCALILNAPLFAKERPNIILFLVDDMGWQDTSLPFWKEQTELNRTYETPNMERLARMGVKFTNAYANSISTPTRVSLMTGANVAQHKVSTWTLNKDVSTDGFSETLEFPGWNLNGLSPRKAFPNTFYAKCLPQILSENDYTTMMVGKAHFGSINTPAQDPLSIGFEYNIGGHAAGRMGSYLGETNYGGTFPAEKARIWAVPHLEAYHGSHTFLTDALTLEAEKLIDIALEKEKPFFLYMSHYAVHIPFDTDDRFYQKYIDKGLPHKEAQYASLLEGMDKSLGDLMDYVQEKGIADNTVIMFMSDNGGLTNGGRDNKNAPLKSGKGSLYEGGIREPMIVYYPNVTTANTSTDAPIIIEDFFSTILEIAEVKSVSTPQTIDGESFIPVLKGSRADRNKPLYFHFPNHWDARLEDAGYPQSAIIIGDWKLIYDYETEAVHLFNLKDDISEQHSLAQDQSQEVRVASMRKQLSDYLKSQKATMPVCKETKKQVNYPDGTPYLL